VALEVVVWLEFFEDDVRVRIGPLLFFETGGGHLAENGVGIYSSPEERVNGGLAELHEDVSGFGAGFDAICAVQEELADAFLFVVVNGLLRGLHLAVLDMGVFCGEVDDLVLLAAENEWLQHGLGTFDSLC
jgi:hypothetical protein